MLHFPTLILWNGPQSGRPGYRPSHKARDAGENAPCFNHELLKSHLRGFWRVRLWTSNLIDIKTAKGSLYS